MSSDREPVIRIENFRDLKMRLGIYILGTAFKDKISASMMRATKLMLENGGHIKCG